MFLCQNRLCRKKECCNRLPHRSLIRGFLRCKVPRAQGSSFLFRSVFQSSCLTECLPWRCRIQVFWLRQPSAWPLRNHRPFPRNFFRLPMKRPCCSLKPYQTAYLIRHSFLSCFLTHYCLLHYQLFIMHYYQFFYRFLSCPAVRDIFLVSKCQGRSEFIFVKIDYVFKI